MQGTSLENELADTRGQPSGSRRNRAVRVLVVDDDTVIRSSFMRVLRHDGCEVLSAANGSEALRMVGERQPDVVVSDICMPGVDGVALLRALRLLHRDLPVIFATGVPSLDTAIEAIDCAADAYLRKPVNPHELCRAVRRAESRHRQRALDEQLAALCGLEVDSEVVSELSGLPGPADDTFERTLRTLRLDYQPIIRSADSEIYGYEALLRSEWMSPPATVELACRLGRIHELGRRVRTIASARFAAERSDATLFLNLHPHDLSDDDLLRPEALLSRIAGKVILEVTEYASLNTIPALRERLSSLRQLGFRLALDDLGERHANLGAIALLEPDIIKLSMSLVRNIHKERTKRALVGSMVGVAREMGAMVVAEGVENEAELEILLRLGVDLLQGYLFARPSDDLRPSSLPPSPGCHWGGWSTTSALVTQCDGLRKNRVAESVDELALVR